jgi:hypothetical protein
MTAARTQIVTEPRTQETRPAQVLAKAGPPLPEQRAGRIPIADRVSKRMAENEDGSSTTYFGSQLRASLMALQEYADEFDREGQREKAVQFTWWFSGR